MLLLNFSHPLTASQRTAIEALAGQPITWMVDQMPQFEHAQAFAPQIAALVAGVRLTSSEWQTMPILVNLPGYAPGAAALLAELHGRMGHFPAIVRLRPVAGSNPTVYEVAEVINLQALRETARQQR